MRSNLVPVASRGALFAVGVLNSAVSDYLKTVGGNSSLDGFAK